VRRTCELAQQPRADARWVELLSGAALQRRAAPAGSVTMRPVHAAATWLAILAPGVPAAATEPGTQAPPRMVVGFANDMHGGLAPAGATDSRYGGEGYHASQAAQLMARRVAAQYALRPVASWPIKALSMHCVVFEITDGKAVSEVLAELSKDARVVLAQPLQQFHTLTDANAQGVSYNDPLYDLQICFAPASPAHARPGRGERVALIDTGVDSGHPTSPAASPARIRTRERRAVVGMVAPRHCDGGRDRRGRQQSRRHRRYRAARAAGISGPAGSSSRADAAACNTTLAQALAAPSPWCARQSELRTRGPAADGAGGTGLKRGVTFVGAAAGPQAPFRPPSVASSPPAAANTRCRRVPRCAGGALLTRCGPVASTTSSPLPGGRRGADRGDRTAARPGPRVPSGASLEELLDWAGRPATPGRWAAAFARSTPARPRLASRADSLTRQGALPMLRRSVARTTHTH
jgi:hypothetical protein